MRFYGEHLINAQASLIVHETVVGSQCFKGPCFNVFKHFFSEGKKGIDKIGPSLSTVTRSLTANRCIQLLSDQNTFKYINPCTPATGICQTKLGEKMGVVKSIKDF